MLGSYLVTRLFLSFQPLSALCYCVHVLVIPKEGTGHWPNYLHFVPLPLQPLFLSESLSPEATQDSRKDRTDR
jgi:hypothetical protein